MCSSRLLRHIFERFASNAPDQVSMWHLSVPMNRLNSFFSSVFTGLFRCCFHQFCSIANLTKRVFQNRILIKVKSF
jgi:hypothetical protein